MAKNTIDEMIEVLIAAKSGYKIGFRCNDCDVYSNADNPRWDFSSGSYKVMPGQKYTMADKTPRPTKLTDAQVLEVSMRIVFGASYSPNNTEVLVALVTEIFFKGQNLTLKDLAKFQSKADTPF